MPCVIGMKWGLIMARILNLFGINASPDKQIDSESSEASSRKTFVDYDMLGIDGADTAIFGSLAETQQSIDMTLSSVVGGLSSVNALTTQMSELQTNFGKLFEDYRKLVVASLKIEQDRDRLSEQYSARSEEADTLRQEAMSARRELEAARIGLAKAQDDAETFEKRNHILEISRKEIEQELSTATFSLRSVSDEAESQKLELVSLRQQVDTDAARITDLNARHHEAYEKSLLLAERCDNYEATLKNCYDQISALQGTIDSLTQERGNLESYAQQKDAETAQLRADMSRAFEKSQTDLKGKDKELAELRAENEGYRASGKILEQINLELKFDNEAKASQIRHQEEVIGKHELSISKAEAKLSRVTADLDAAQAAKNQIEQSRSAMSSRVDAITQALRGREADVSRLETDVVKLTNQLEDHTARSRGMIEALQSRVFELEKDLAAQKNETAYYYAQVEIMKKPENRGQ